MFAKLDPTYDWSCQLFSIAENDHILGGEFKPGDISVVPFCPDPAVEVWNPDKFNMKLTSWIEHDFHDEGEESDADSLGDSDDSGDDGDSGKPKGSPRSDKGWQQAESFC